MVLWIEVAYNCDCDIGVGDDGTFPALGTRQWRVTILGIFTPQKETIYISLLYSLVKADN